jgi:2-hydroxychromene-2-carboxylate isomerase
VDAFWEIHDRFYANQGELWSADRDYFVNAALSVGVDQAQFESCYDGGDGHFTVTQLDGIRRERGIFNRPTFEIDGQFLLGSQRFATFMGFIDAFLNL